MASSRNKVLKVIVLGEAGVGKTSLLQQFVNNLFSTTYKATIGIDILTKDVFVGDQIVSLQIWDTAGQERFQSLSVGYFRDAHCCILVYDVTSSASFKKLDNWYDIFLIHAGPRRAQNFPIVVIGNKTDCRNIEVSTKRALEWCAHHGDLPYFETSAKQCINVEQAFRIVVELALSQLSTTTTDRLDRDRLDTQSSERITINALQPSAESKRNCC